MHIHKANISKATSKYFHGIKTNILFKYSDREKYETAMGETQNLQLRLIRREIVKINRKRRH